MTFKLKSIGVTAIVQIAYISSFVSLKKFYVKFSFEQFPFSQIP